MVVRRVREVWPQGGARAPRLVIDERGSEVAVLVDYGQYVVLLQMIAGAVDGGSLPPYWRSALDDCLAVGR